MCAGGVEGEERGLGVSLEPAVAEPVMALCVWGNRMGEEAELSLLSQTACGSNF